MTPVSPSCRGLSAVAALAGRWPTCPNPASTCRGPFGVASFGVRPRHAPLSTTTGRALRPGIRSNNRRADIGSRGGGPGSWSHPDRQTNAGAGHGGAGYGKPERVCAQCGEGAELDIELSDSGDDAWGGASIQYRGGENVPVGERRRKCRSNRLASPEAGVARHGCDLAVGERREIRLPAGSVERHDGAGLRRIGLRIDGAVPIDYDRKRLGAEATIRREAAQPRRKAPALRVSGPRTRKHLPGAGGSEQPTRVRSPSRRPWCRTRSRPGSGHIWG